MTHDMIHGWALGEKEREALLAQTRRLAELAREEDLGRGDITSQLVADQGVGKFLIRGNQDAIFAGCEIAQTVLDVYDAGIEIRWLDLTCDGGPICEPPMGLAEITGSVKDVLSAERVLLNFLQRLCGVATLTSRYVEAMGDVGTPIMDTRKTTPGWRRLEKYAVRCGGGTNHRFGLYDAILIKDNHLSPFDPDQTAATVFEMLNNAATLDPPPLFVEVEADCMEQVEQLFTVVGIDRVLLDNFSLDDMRQAVKLRNSLNLRAKISLEASGGVTLDTVRDIAETGVDYISVGAITHSATAMDLSLDRIE